ncbi:MAG: spermidine resistance protein [Chaenotheca gracillima]|nr:MAG: spermidine resistance protein [Chaenotheca gracillima]
MSSPPNTDMSTSPTYPAHSTLPSKKRPSSGSAGDSSGAKRRKASFASAASHPLRQTSFPPEESASGGARSPSVESNSVVGGAAGEGGAGGTKRGRRQKSDVRSLTGDSVRGRKTAPGSVVDGKSGGSAGRGGGGASVAAGGGDEEEDDEEEGEGDMDAGMIAEGGEQTNDEQERQRLGILIEAFNSDQSDRYDAFRRAKLSHASVRKIANQTLSQSIPDPAVKTINGFTKIFIGELICRAREVQAQWNAAAATATPVPEQNTSNTNNSSQQSTLSQPHENIYPYSRPFAASNPSYQTPYTPSASFSTQHTTPSLPSSQEKPSQAVLAPLQPDHLREALRRYRRDKEGGGAGMKGLSLAAMQDGFATAGRANGSRLFR